MSSLTLVIQRAALDTGDKIITLIEESIGSQEATAGQIDEASRSCLCLFSKSCRFVFLYLLFILGNTI